MTPYYERDGITLYHADARDVLPTLERVSHCLTDPPYEAEAHTKGRRGNTARDGNSAYFATRPITFSPMTAEFRNEIGAEIERLTERWILIFCQVEAAMLWRHSVSPAEYVRTQIWRKPNGPCQFTGDRPGMGYESILTCWNDVGRSRWNGGGRHGFYEHMTVHNGTGHETEKPLPLMRELVELFTDPGDLILDCFAGSGTTLVAAYGLGRRAIGVELEEKYCEVAAKRLEACTPPLFTTTPEPAPEQGVMM